MPEPAPPRAGTERRCYSHRRSERSGAHDAPIPDRVHPEGYSTAEEKEVRLEAFLPPVATPTLLPSSPPVSTGGSAEGCACLRSDAPTAT